jgi:hypothetical protein
MSLLRGRDLKLGLDCALGIAVLAGTVVGVALLYVRIPGWWKWISVIAFVAAIATGFAVLFWPRRARRLPHRPSTSRRPREGRRTVAHQPGGNNKGSLVGQRRPAAGDTTDDGAPRHPRAGEAASRVALAALTTSGVSGLTVDRGSSGSFDVYAATQVGLQHARYGHTREDAYAVGGAPDQGWVFSAVADGLGSAEDSHAAAQFAAQAAVKLMRQRVPGIDPRYVADEWSALARGIAAEIAASLDSETVAALAHKLGYRSGRAEQIKHSPPACTLVFAALGPVSSNGYPLLWGSVGDCELISVALDSGATNWLTYNATKQPGGMVSNVTDALPRDHERLCYGYQFVAPTTMTVLASDGMADAIRQEFDQYSELLPKVAGASLKEWEFGELVGFDLPGLHDDRTIVAAWPRRSSQPLKTTAGG